MSNVIEDRIVKMTFDNKNFESNVQQSLGTIDKLNKSLDTTQENNAFAEIDKSSKKINLDGLTRSVENLAKKFNILDIVGVTALTKIAGKAIDAGLNMAKSVSMIGQVNAGWEKYAQKTQAVQTIMAATASTWEDTAERIGFAGSQLEFVESQISKINWFTDETSYNFTDMVSNIGKFTSNGVELDDAVNAMQGVANWAAISGANVQQASRAMNNLSQAMGSGALRLQDWMSIESVNMNTREFEQTAIDTAVELGILKKAGEDVEGVWEVDAAAAQKLGLTLKKGEVTLNGFRNSLQTGWLSSEVLVKTLNKYGSAATKLNEVYEAFNGDYTTSEIINLAKSYKEGTIATSEFQKISETTGLTIEQLTGYFEELTSEEMAFGLKAFQAGQEAKTFADAIEATKDAVSTSWMNIFQTIFGNYEEAKVLWTDFANFLWEVFAGPLTKLDDVLQIWREKLGRAFLFDEETGALYKLGGAISSIVEPIKQAWKELFPDTADAEWWAQKLTDLSEGFSKLVDRMKPSEKTAERLKSVFRGLFAVADIIRNAFMAVARVAKEKLLPPLQKLFDCIFGGTSVLGEHIVKLRDYLKENDTFYKVLKKVADIVEKVLVVAFKNIKKAITEFTNGIKGVGYEFAVLDESGNVIETYGSLFWKAGEAVGKVIDKINELTGIDLRFSKIKSFGDLWDAVKEKIDNVKTAISNIALAWQNFKSGVSGGEITLLEGEDSEKINKISSALYTFGENVGIVIDTLKKFGGEGVERFKEVFNGKGIKVKNVLKLAGAVVLFKKVFDFAKAKKEMLGLFQSIKKSFSALPGVLEGLGETFEAFAFSMNATALKNIAIAVGILTLSLIALSFVDGKKIAISLAAITAMVGEMVGAMILLQKFVLGGPIRGLFKGGALMKASKSILIFAAAIAILSLSMFLLGKLKMDELGRGILGVSSALALLLAGIAVLGKIKIPKSGIGQLILLAGALLIMAIAIKKFGEMDLYTIAKGFIGVAASLLLLIAAMAILDKLGVKTIAGVGIAMAAMAAAVMVLAIAIERMAAIDFNAFVSGFARVALTLGLLVVAMNLLPAGTTLGTAIALVALAASLLLMYEAVAKFGEMPLENLIQGILAVAAGLGILVIAINLCQGGLLGAAAILVMAIALNVLVPVLQNLGAMSWEEIARGLVALAGALAILILAAAGAQSLALGFIILSAALIALGIGFALFVPQFIKMAELSWEQVATGLVALAGALAILILGAAGAQTLALGFIILSAAMLALGVAALLVGAGMGLAAGAIEALASIPDMTGTGKQLGDLALGLGEIALAGLAVLAAIPGVLGLAAALLLLGVGCMLSVIPFPIIIENLKKIREVRGAFKEAKGVDKDIKELAGAIKELGKVKDDALIAATSLTTIGASVSMMSVACKSIGIDVQTFNDAIATLISQAMSASSAFAMIAVGIATLNSSVTTMSENGSNEILKDVARTMEKFADSSSKLSEGLSSAFASMRDFIALKGEIDAAIPKIRSAIIRFLDNAQSTITSYNKKFKSAGETLMLNFSQGIRNKGNTVKTSARDVTKEALDELETDRARELGEAFGQGYADGIRSKIGAVREAAGELADAAAKKVAATQNSSSPSKVAMALGRYLSEGYAIGIANAGYMAEDAAGEMVNRVLDTATYLSERIREKLEEETSPVITPVLDTSKIDAGSMRLSSSFGGIVIPTTVQRASFAGSAFGATQQNQNGSETVSNSVNNYFTQNNYSPKPLSRVEIYRQTKNLFAAKKGAVRA